MSSLPVWLNFESILLTPHSAPTGLTIWDWLFDSPYSVLFRNANEPIRGYNNAFTGERIDYAQVKEHTIHLSTALVKKYGLKNGETVALFSPNTIWYPVAMLGTLRAGLPPTRSGNTVKRWLMVVRHLGGVVSGASPAYNVEEMTYALKTANAKFLMTIPSSMNVAAAAAKNAGIPKERVFLLEGSLDGHTSMQELLQKGKSYGSSGQVSSFKIPVGKRNKDICGFLSSSSGTTGLPKAVRLATHYSDCSPLTPFAGYDCTSECHCTMSTSPTDYTSRPDEDPSCSTSLS